MDGAVMRDPYETAERFKAQGIGRQESWSRWVQATALRPGMDAKDWYAIYDSVEAYFPAQPAPANINATHYDNVRQCEVEIVKDQYGVFEMRWADGGTGSNPPCLPPGLPRYIPLTKSHTVL